MRNLYSLLLIIFFTSFYSFGQGIIRGKITDEHGQGVFGAKLYINTIKKFGGISDLDGNYSVTLKESEAMLIVGYEGYDTIQESFTIKNNDIYEKNFTLTPGNVTLTEVKVVSKIKKSNDSYMDKMKINSATTIDFISSETMKKTGDPNVSAAVARVSGVSTNGNGFITVRGIGDRYVKTTLNGSRIPTLDPLTNNIKLDIFPASLVDNIIITKTASPDLPGDFAGAYISVETKDYPNKLEVNVETQVGYNAQTTFKDFISSQRSSTDWMGFDNGLRTRKDAPLVNPNLTITTYDEMKALGLSNYYNSLGVNSSWIDGSPQGDTYFKLGLVQLGLLSKAQINDADAYNSAKSQYNSVYKPQAFEKINPDGKDYNNGFAHNWNTLTRKAPLNYSQSFSVGDQVKLFGKPLGYLVGFRYNSAVRYDPSGISQRLRPSPGSESGFEPEVQDSAKVSRQTNGWSGLINFAYKLNDKNKLSLLFMPNFTGTNDVSSYATMPDLNGSVSEGRTQAIQFYEQRKQLIYQFKSEHFIAKPKIKIDYNASYTQGNSIVPDFKITQYGYSVDNKGVGSFTFAPTAGLGIHRYYRYLNENILDTRISAEMPIHKKETTLTRKIKFGGSYQRTDRKSDMQDFYLNEGNTLDHPNPDNSDIESFLNPDRFIMKNGLIDYVFSNTNNKSDHTIGNSSIKAGFLLLDYELNTKFRFSGGVRVEQAQIFSDVEEYHRLKYLNNDIRRFNGIGMPVANAANFNELNVLPSANFVYKLKEYKGSNTNVRLNVSQTVARPSIREMSDIASFDNEYRTVIYGNSDLKAAHVTNYDFRTESYFKNGDNISVSLFYKEFKNHIELGFGNGGLSWINVDKSTVKGIEFELKKSITKFFEFRTNVTVVNSVSSFIQQNITVVDGIKVFNPIDTINRPMFGQAPYIINAMLMYKADSLGLTATIGYNVQGPKLVIGGVGKIFANVYEMPRNTIDFKLTKTLGEHFSMSIQIRDILNARVRRAYKLPTGWSTYDSYRYGTNYVLGVAYKL